MSSPEFSRGSGTMKAIRVRQFGEPEVMRIEDGPVPQPSEGQVLVRLYGIGVNPVETYVRSGKYGALPPLPYTPGADAAGIVEAVGKEVTHWKTGDRVYTSGTLTGAYAELAVCKESQVHSLPPRISFEQGAAINIPYATAFRALFQRARAIPGETVLIHGASGGVGLAAAQLARAAGLRTIGTAGTEKGRRLVGDQGVPHVLDHGAPDYLESIKSLTHARGVDVILEMLANVNLGKDLTALARGGRIVIIGSRGSVELNPRDAMIREAAILGMVLFNASEAELFSIHAGLASGLENGSLNPVVGQRIPLAEAPRAHHQVMTPGAHGKIVLVP